MDLKTRARIVAYSKSKGEDLAVMIRVRAFNKG